MATDQSLLPCEMASPDPPASQIHPSGTTTMSTRSSPEASSSLGMLHQQSSQEQDDAISRHPVSGPSKAYEGQPQDMATSFELSEVKAYPGQPMPNPFQQSRQYYNPDGRPSEWSMAVPLHALQSVPCPVDCPVCRHREITRTEAVTGMTTQ